MIATEMVSVIQKGKEVYPVNVHEIAKRLGLRVKETALPSSVSGKLVKSNRGLEIQVNASHSENRKRFTIAHEIAHFVLHSELFEHEISDNEMYRSKQISNALETQANNYAAELLMPRYLIEKRYLELDANGMSLEAIINRMAEDFQVSEDAMRIRFDAGLRQNTCSGLDRLVK